jgi:site-specific DNA recombinase
MKRAAKSATADTARKQAVIYARVSSKEQEKEGFSIPAQLKLLKEYAAKNDFAVAQQYIDVETAKQTGRAAFGEMVSYLKAHPPVRVMLVEKTDRLYRNLKDWVTVDELDVEMHSPKEFVVLSRESRSSEKFMHGIKVLMAKKTISTISPRKPARACRKRPSRASGRPRRRWAIATSSARTARRSSPPIPRCHQSWRLCSNGMRAATFR